MVSGWRSSIRRFRLSTGESSARSRRRPAKAGSATAGRLPPLASTGTMAPSAPGPVVTPSSVVASTTRPSISGKARAPSPSGLRVLRSTGRTTNSPSASAVTASTPIWISRSGSSRSASNMPSDAAVPSSGRGSNGMAFTVIWSPRDSS